MPDVAQTVATRPALRPPGPPPVRTPWDFYRYFRDITADPIAFVMRRFSLYGDIYYAPLRDRDLFAVRHPEHLDQVLVAQGFAKTETGITARQMQHFLGRGLLNSNGDFWRRQRRLINPALRRRAIGAYADTIVEHTLRWSSAHRDGARLDLSAEMMELTLRIVARALFDHDVRADSDTIARAMDVFRSAIGSPAFLLPGWVPLPPVQRARRAMADLDAIVYRLIDERTRVAPQALAGRTDLLSALVASVDDDGDGATSMSRRQLRDEILTLFLAGHETTSHTLTWSFYLLARHPGIEAELAAQVASAAAGRDRIELDDLAQVPLCAQVIDEAMRLYPPAPVVSRTATGDTRLGEFDVATGSEVIVWIWATHHDPRWHPEPEAFRPSRFAPDAAPMVKGSYLPFGAGQRTCIGKHFALMEARLVLANILRHWHIRLADPTHRAQPRVAVTLSPRGGLPVELHRRSGVD